MLGPGETRLFLVLTRWILYGVAPLKNSPQLKRLVPRLQATQCVTMISHSIGNGCVIKSFHVTMSALAIGVLRSLHVAMSDHFVRCVLQLVLQSQAWIEAGMINTMAECASARWIGVCVCDCKCVDSRI